MYANAAMCMDFQPCALMSHCGIPPPCKVLHMGSQLCALMWRCGIPLTCEALHMGSQPHALMWHCGIPLTCEALPMESQPCVLMCLLQSEYAQSLLQARVTVKPKLACMSKCTIKHDFI